MPRNEFLHAVDTALLQHKIARGCFNQYRKVAPCDHRDIHSADAHSEDILMRCIERQAFDLREVATGRTMQMDDQLQALFSPHRRFAEHDAYVQYTQTSHFEKIAQQFRAAPLKRIRCDMVQFHDVVGNQSATAGDEFQPEFAFADRAFAGDHHADTQHVEQHAVACGGFGELLGEIVSDQPHQLHAGFGGAKQRNVRLVGEGDQLRRDVAGTRHDQAGRAALFDLPERVAALVHAQGAQIIQLDLPQDLHPVRVDQIEVADQPFVGSGDLAAVDDAVGTIRAGHAAQFKPRLLVLEQLPDVDLAHALLFQS